MLLSDLSIRRPVFAAVMMLALVTLGLFSYKRLALDQYPNVEIPVLVITTQFPGASPESIERELSKKIEDAVNPIAGVKHVVSTSMEGVSIVVVQFQLEVRINEAVNEARAKINAIRGDLPAGIEDPVIEKIDFASAPVISLAVRADSMTPRELSTLVDRKIKRRLESISGIGKVELVGLTKREVNVDVDPLRLQALGMGVDEVVGGLRTENVNTPLGRVLSGGTEMSMRVSGKPEQASRFSELVIGQRAGRPVSLGDVATIRDGTEEQRTMAFVNGASAIGVNIQKQSGANTVDLVVRVRAAVEKLSSELPPGVKIAVVRDASVFIVESVDDVKTSLFLGGLLTVFIVFCFLNSWRSTVITGLTLPISVISSFIVMNFMGMTLNIMTLMALSLAIGMLIDDAIVVRENIVRHLEMGKDHFRAAKDGTSEIGLAVLATSLSIVAVFVPVAFMKGIVGRFFFAFGITVTWAVLVSLFVSFTLDPMLSSRWEDPDIERTGKRHLVARILDVFNDWFDRTADRYKGMIGWALDHRKSVLLLAFAAFVGGILVFGMLESTFMQKHDRGEFAANFQSAPDASIQETRNRLDAVLSVIREMPEVDHTYATIGANDTTVRDASIYVKLKEKAERKRSQEQVMSDLRGRMLRIPGIVPTLGEAENMRAGEKQLMINLRGDDLGKLKEYGRRLKDEFGKIPGIVDLGVTLEHDIPEYRLSVDRRRASDAGLNTGDIVRTVGALVGGQAVTTWEDEEGDAIDVRVRLPERLRQDPKQVEGLRLAVRKANGAVTLVPLGGIVRYGMEATPSEIGRRDLSRQVTVSANLEGVPLGTAMKRVEAAASRVPMEPGYHVVFSGEAEDMVETFGYMAEALLLAIVFVYLILAAQFESFIDPLSIMLSLPLSLVGMAGMLYLTGDSISIMSLIGLIMLMGLVTKNAILLVDYAKTLRAGGMARREAMIVAGRTRLRPIMMTTAAMVFGMLPLALALGAGAEMRAPMARAVIGGLLTSTFLTLLVVPVTYTVLDDFGDWLKRRWTHKKGGSTLAAVVAMTVLGGLPFAARGADNAVRVLTLREAVDLAMAHNRDVAAARELRSSVTGRYVEERASALPQLTFSSGMQRSWDETSSAATFMPSGTTVRFGRFDLSQSLYTWGQVESALRAAKIGFANADDRLRFARQAAERAVTASFYDVLLAREFQAIALRNLEQKERHLDEAKKKQAAGVATDYDVLVSQVSADNAKPDVIRTKNAVRAALERLRFTLGVGPQPVDVEGALEAAKGAPVPTFEEVLASAWKRRPELSELHNRQKIASELVAIADAGDKPRLDLKASTGWQDFESGPFSGDGKTWSGGLFVSWPLFDGMRTRGKVAQAQSDVRTLGIEEARLIDAVSLQARTALDNVAEAAAIASALSGTVAQAERLLALAEKGYEFGVKTRLDVEDAEMNLTAARGNLARARRDELVARTDLRHVMGLLGEEAAAISEKSWVPAANNGDMLREVLSGAPAME
jgi:HAE1 family hydrophobic/amphiphilic exporter-1